MALSIDMLKMTGDPVVADEIELSLTNAGLGSLSRSGRWATYNTPMEGDRRAFYVDANWQAQPGSPELSCCAVNAPRSLGMISDWAVMEHESGVALNYYGPGAIQTQSPDGNQIVLTQATDYPVSGQIVIGIELEQEEELSLFLRIPQWSRRTSLQVNGDAAVEPRAGAYAELQREWKTGDTVTLNLDMSPHYWVGEGDCEGRSSIFRGPVLLSYDPRFNNMPADAVPAFDVLNMKESAALYSGWLQPWMLFEYSAVDGSRVRLCDFASAGCSGRRYSTWFPVDNVEKAEFSASNTFRSARKV